MKQRMLGQSSRGKQAEAAKFEAAIDFLGTADWETRLVHALPEELKGILPTAEELEAELERVEQEKEHG